MNLCVWEREGRIWTFQNSIRARRKKNSCSTSATNARAGTIPVCSASRFIPGFATNHYVFVYYTWVKPGTVAGSPNTRPNPLCRTLSRPAGTLHARPERRGDSGFGSCFVDLKPDRLASRRRHVFHPKNGFLYWTDGDNSVGDNDQIINKSLFSGVFRIDVDCRGGNISHPIPRQPANGVTANYFIPNDNPFRRPVQRA
jgi:hypothetical protein